MADGNVESVHELGKVVMPYFMLIDTIPGLQDVLAIKSNFSFSQSLVLHVTTLGVVHHTRRDEERD